MATWPSPATSRKPSRPARSRATKKPRPCFTTAAASTAGPAISSCMGEKETADLISRQALAPGPFFHHHKGSTMPPTDADLLAAARKARHDGIKARIREFAAHVQDLSH